MSFSGSDAAAARPTLKSSRRQPQQLQAPAATVPVPTFSSGQVINGQFQLQTQLHTGPRSSVWRAVCTATPLPYTPAAAGWALDGANHDPNLSGPPDVVLKFLPSATPVQQAAAQQELASTTAVTAAAAAAAPTTPVTRHHSPVSRLLSSFRLGAAPPAASQPEAAAGLSSCGSGLVLVLAPAHEPLTTLLAYQRSRGRAGLPTPAVLQLARCGLQALDMAHRRAGVAHLDVKPANLLLDTPFLRPAQHQPQAQQQKQQQQQQQGQQQQQQQEDAEQEEQGRPPRAGSRQALGAGRGWRTPSAADLAAAGWVLVDWGSASRLLTTPQPPVPAASGASETAAAVGHGRTSESAAAAAAAAASPTASPSSRATAGTGWRAPPPSATQQQQQPPSRRLRQAPWLCGAKAAECGLVMGRPAYDTPAYAAPEVLLQGGLTPAADMWSLGTTLFEAATGVPLLQLPTKGPALGALLTWLQRQQQKQQQEGDPLGVDTGSRPRDGAAAQQAVGAAGSGSSGEELLDGAQLALIEALAAGRSSSSSSSLFEWPQSLATATAAPTWLTATRLLRRPWSSLAADARLQLAAAASAAPSVQGSPGGTRWGGPGVYWGWRWPWQLAQVAEQQQEEVEGMQHGLPVQPLRVLLQAGGGLCAGPDAAAPQGRKLEYEEACQLAGLLAPLLVLDPTRRPAPATLLQHPALQALVDGPHVANSAP